MARKRYVYLLERIRDSRDWPKGIRIWADMPCTGWRIVEKRRIRE